MGGGKLPPVPDYKIYKVEGLKGLEWTRDALAARGLKDPWLRNEAWRYQQWPGFGKAARTTFFRGFKLAAAAMIVTIAVDKMLGISDSKHHEDSHH